MKRIIILVKKFIVCFFIFLLISISCYSQATETSWENLIGEDVLFLPISNRKLDIKFDCFFEDSLCTKPLNQFNYQIRHSVENNIFKVLNSYKLLSFGPRPSRTYITKLQSPKTGIIYLKIDYANSGNMNTLSFYLTGLIHNKAFGNPVIPLKTFETYKKLIGETFAAKESLTQQHFKSSFALDPNYYLGEMVDIESGEVLRINKFDLFKCVDLQLFSARNSIFKHPYLILQNNVGNKFKVYLTYDEDDKYNIQKKLSLSSFYTSKQYEAVLEVYTEIEEYKKEKAKIAQLHKEECIRLFGKEKGSNIADGRVKIGMTEEMCLYAWGKPNDINRTITRYSVSEQWVYDIGTYLYFENGLLVTIQN